MDWIDLYWDSDQWRNEPSGSMKWEDFLEW
jgi:hypothetical protein